MSSYATDSRRRSGSLRFSHDDPAHPDEEFYPPAFTPSPTTSNVPQFTRSFGVNPSDPPPPAPAQAYLGEGHRRFGSFDQQPHSLRTGFGPEPRRATSRPPQAYPLDNRRDSDSTLLDESKFTSFPSKDTSPSLPRTVPPTQPTSPLRPVLRRSSTEDQLRYLAAREAIDLVSSHTQHLDYTRGGDSTQRQGAGQGGVLSHLLQLYGNQAAGQRGREESKSSAGSSVGDEEKARPPSRQYRQHRPKVLRSQSEVSLGDYFVDDDDPRARTPKVDNKAVDESHQSFPVGGAMGRKRSYSSDGHPEEDVDKWRRKWEKERKVYEAMKNKFEPEDGNDGKKKKKGSKRGRALSITAHVADILQRQNFILKLAKALMTFGAPSHRLESQLNATAKVLDVDAQFIHIPSVVIASFGDTDTHTSETKFVKASGGLNLGMLHEVHGVYRSVVHDEIGVEEGNVLLTKMLTSKPIYNLWQRMCIAAMCAGIIAPLGFAGSFIDAFAAGAFGAILAFLQLYAARRNAIFSNIFEISIAALISFTARGLSTTNLFCYEALSSAGVVLVLPGYVILCGSLELASKNLVAGSVRMVYAIIYTLFLGFSIAVGSDLFYLFDPKARHARATTNVAVETIVGTFLASNTSNSFQGSFTFTNTSAPSASQTAMASLQRGNVMCYRDPSWEWWRQGVSVYWLILLVPAFSLFLSLWNLQPIRSRELPVMCFIAIIGFVANRLATQYIFNRSDIVSFIGATVIGLLGNAYSRIFKGTSFTSMATGVLFLVPSGVAAAGGLAMSNSADGNSYNSGLTIGFRMVQVAIGITIGLFFSSFIIYSVGSKRKGGGLGFAF